MQAHQQSPIPSIRNSRPEVPDWLDAAFRRMVAKEPEARYQSMGEVIEALSRAHRSGRRRKRLWLGGSLAAALLMVAGVALFSSGLIRGPVRGLGTVVVGADQPDTQVVVGEQNLTNGKPSGNNPARPGGEPTPEKNVKRPGSNRPAPGPEQVGGRWAELAGSGTEGLR
jgi:hypothetical protein